MIVPQWLCQLQRGLFLRPSLKSRNTQRRAPAHPRVRLYLEPLEDRWAPSADLVTVTAGSVSTPFSESQQTLTLTASVKDATNPGATVSEGTVTFTVKDQQGNTIGSPVQGAVSNGSASANNFNLPASEAVGSYTIDVSYSDTPDNFTDDGTDTPGTLAVTPAVSTTTAANATAVFSSSDHTVQLTASVTSSAGTVNEGSVQFTLVDSKGNTIGSPISGNVSNGSASVNYVLPGGTAIGSYTIKAAYTDSSGAFDPSSDNTHSLTLSAASTTTTASSTTTSFSESDQTVQLTASVTSSTGTVNEGSVQFTLVDSNGNTIGSPISGDVSNSSASVGYIVPGGTAAGVYTIEAAYSDSAGNFVASSDNTQSLTINAAGATTVGLTAVNIVPNPTGGTAQVTLTAQVSNPAGIVNEGTVSFTLAGVSGQGKVGNGTATVQLTVPLLSTTYGLGVTLSYTDSAAPADLAESSITRPLSTSVWDLLLSAQMTFDSSNSEHLQFLAAGLPLFSLSFSPSTGLLSQINLGSLSVPVMYANIGNNVVASVEGVPWGMIFYNSSGQFQGLADVETAPDGSLQWVIYDSNHHPTGTIPYGE